MTTLRDEVIGRIERQETLSAVIGMGYVGLPLMVELARGGFHVIGLDVDQRKVEAVNAGRSYVGDVPGEVLAGLVRSGLIRAAEGFEALREADTITICVPTPLGKTRDPDLSMVMAAVEDIGRRIRRGQLVIMESTTYPGTTEELIQPRLEQGGLKAGSDFFLVFSPERVDPGNPVYQTANTPKIIGGVTADCAAVATALYSRVIEPIVPVSSARSAEMVKLLENTFRSVNIGLVNEVALMCDRLGVDVWEVIDAAATKPFGFMPFYPGPGLGGHCIPVDPHYLSWKLKTLNYRARFIELAGEVNSEMPLYVVSKVNDALNRMERSVRGSRILVLGVAYKRDIEDVRESPALDVLRLLQEKGGIVSYHDPYVPSLRVNGATLESIPLEEGLAGCHCAVITTDHRSVDYRQVVERAQVVIDTRNATRGIASDRIVRL